MFGYWCNPSASDAGLLTVNYGARKWKQTISIGPSDELELLMIASQRYYLQFKTGNFDWTRVLEGWIESRSVVQWI